MKMKNRSCRHDINSPRVRHENKYSKHKLRSNSLRLSRKKRSQPAITCSKLTIETLEQRCEICSKLTIINLCSSVSIVNFEHVNAGWVTYINNAHIFESLPRNCENKFRKKF